MTEATTLGGPGSTGAVDVAGGVRCGGPTVVESSGGPNEHPAIRAVKAATAVTRSATPKTGGVGDTEEA